MRRARPQGYNTLFDRGNKRIGFAPVQNCAGTLMVHANRPAPNEPARWVSLAGARADVDVVSGDNQKGHKGSTLPEPLVVKGATPPPFPPCATCVWRRLWEVWQCGCRGLR